MGSNIGKIIRKSTVKLLSAASAALSGKLCYLEIFPQCGTSQKQPVFFKLKNNLFNNS